MTKASEHKLFLDNLKTGLVIEQTAYGQKEKMLDKVRDSEF